MYEVDKNIIYSRFNFSVLTSSNYLQLAEDTQYLNTYFLLPKQA